MLYFQLILTFALINGGGYCSLLENSTVSEDSADVASMGSIIQYYGYPFENHTTRTEDGYLLSLGRIPVTPHNQRSCNRTRGVVVLAHGFISNGDLFVFLGPERSLAFLLADRCYDVWITNNRGTMYSMTHASLTIRDRAYWNFTFTELACFDTRSSLDYVINATGVTKLHYVGYSTGTTQFLILLAMMPQYETHIASAHLMGPIVFISHSKAWFLEWIPRQAVYVMSKYASELFHRPLFPHEVFSLMSLTAAKECSKENVTATCGIIMDVVDRPLMDRKDVWQKSVGHFPDRFSMKALMHVAQWYMSSNFEMYDYGPERNTEVYGQKEPTSYDLTHLTVPIHLYTSESDVYSLPEDVDRLVKILPKSTVRLKYVFQNLDLQHIQIISLSKNDTRELCNVMVEAMAEFD